MRMIGARGQTWSIGARFGLNFTDVFRTYGGVPRRLGFPPTHGSSRAAGGRVVKSYLHSWTMAQKPLFKSGKKAKKPAPPPKRLSAQKAKTKVGM